MEIKSMIKIGALIMILNQCGYMCLKPVCHGNLSVYALICFYVVSCVCVVCVHL